MRVTAGAGVAALLASLGMPPDAARAGGALLVKYTTSLDACAHSLFEGRRPFESVTGDPSLDALHRALGVSRIDSLFIDRRNLDARAATQKFRRIVERARARFPQRARRAERMTDVRRALRVSRGHPSPDDMPDLSRVYRVFYDESIPPDEAAIRYANNPTVEYAEPDAPVHPLYVPNDPYFSSSGSWGQSFEDLWGLRAIGAQQAWDVSRGDGTLIAVVDTGVDRDHPDLADNIWVNGGEAPNNGVDDDGNGYVDDTWGWDFVQGDNRPVDRDGHGTHVAGTAAAVADNGIGITGVAPGARVMSLRIIASGSGSSGAGAEAILYAALNGADVINNSWATRGVGGALGEAIETAVALGAVVTFAAGNPFGFELSPLPLFRHPEAIFVGGTRHTGGSYLGVSPLDLNAPGRQILSLRGTSDPGDAVVGTRYIVLSGTSMATPHVSGALALLLSALPALSPIEARWHLELSALQPGMTGYEGLPWNPTWGWGVIDAARMFDPPPATTRLSQWLPLSVHQYVGNIRPLISVEHSFTTLAPVSWTASGPPWLNVSPSSGTDAAAVTLDVDASGLPPGTHTGTYRIDAPATIDGGRGFDVTVHAYPDPGLGPEQAVLTGTPGSGLLYGPGIASNGVFAAFAWTNPTTRQAWAASLAPDGSVQGPFVLHGARIAQHGDLAFDGRNFVAIWLEYEGRRRLLMAARLSHDGLPMEPEPRELRRLGRRLWPWDLRIAFDGNEYVVAWAANVTDHERASLNTLRIAADYSVSGKPIQIYRPSSKYMRANTFLQARIACGEGHCLVVWPEREDVGSSEHAIWGLRVIQGAAVGSPFPIIQDLDITDAPEVASDGTNYLVVARGPYVGPCGGGDRAGCYKGLLGARVTAAGAVLDPVPLVLASAPLDTSESVEIGRPGFDGGDYIVPYSLNRDTTPFDGGFLFAARVSPNGEVHASDFISDAGYSRHGAGAGTGYGRVIAWKENDTIHPISGRREYNGLRVRALDHAAGDPTVTLAIGSIGARSLAENETLYFRIAAPGLDATAVVFTAQGLPPGAVFDGDRGVFHWRPTPADSGVHPGVRFEATDGVSSVSEEIDVTVGNVISSVSGTVRLSDGTPLAGAAVRLGGSRPRRVTATGADGSYRFDDLEPRRYHTALHRPTRRSFQAAAARFEIVAPNDDLSGADLVATPR